MKQSAVIIGGGVGGLFCGALLAKNGIEVTVLEKNAIIGGGLQCFCRNGKLFETGMHVMGGWEEGGNLRRLCDYLGITGSLHLRRIPPECSDEIFCRETNETFRIAAGKSAFINSLVKTFPDQRAGLNGYVNEMSRIVAGMPLFGLHIADNSDSLSHDAITTSADALIARHISDPRLQSLLAYISPLYGGIKGHSPAYIHSLLCMHYINGAFRFEGGSRQLADRLAETIIHNGGSVVASAEVKRIAIVNKNVDYLETTEAKRYEADWFISDVHPIELLRLLPSGTFNKGFVRRINTIPSTSSAFTLYIDLKEDTVPYIDHTCYYVENLGLIWQQNEYDSMCWPGGFMYMTPPDRNQGRYASRLIAHAVMPFSVVTKWEDTLTGQRGADYDDWKRCHAEKIIDKLEYVIPGLRNSIRHYYAASPLTIRDYYHTKEGAIFGFRKDCNDPLLSYLSVHTKIPNLLLTGQNINLHGICGVPLTAITTAEAILGKDYILNKLNA